MTETRTIKTDLLARVEGEGAMFLRIRDGRVDDVRLRIYEPPRFFEAFLRGRGYREPVDITARICGICPIAYQMSAVRGDRGRVRRRGPRRDPRAAPAHLLRRVDREPRAARLHAPRAGHPRLRQRDRDGARPPRHRRAGRCTIKKAGNEILRVVGGREIHPVNVRVGGFYRAPRPRELRALVEPLERARELALETVRFTGGLEVPDFEPEHEYVALSMPGRTIRSRAAGSSRPAASTSPRASTRSTSRSCTSSTRPRCTRGCASAAPTSAARSRATR